MASNRIQILNWRQYGDDESYCYVGVVAADDSADCRAEIQAQVDEDANEEDFEGAEERGDWEHVIYYNDDIDIWDGEVLEGTNGRKFLVTITEVKECESK